MARLRCSQATRECHGGALTACCALLTLAGVAAATFAAVLAAVGSGHQRLDPRTLAIVCVVGAAAGCLGLVGWVVTWRETTGDTVALALEELAVPPGPGDGGQDGQPDTFVARAVGPTLKPPPAPGEELPELPGASQPWGPPTAPPLPEPPQSSPPPPDAFGPGHIPPEPPPEATR